MTQKEYVFSQLEKIEGDPNEFSPSVQLITTYGKTNHIGISTKQLEKIKLVLLGEL